MNLFYCNQNQPAKQAIFGTERPVYILKKVELPAESKETEKKSGPGVPIDKEPGKKEEKSKSLIPERPKDAIGGKAFMDKIKGLTGEAREKMIYDEIASGNVPDFMRDFKPIEYTCNDASGKPRKVKLFVMPDYLGVGSEDDFVRTPMTPQTAQLLAEKFDCVMPTGKIVDEITVSGSTKKIPMKIYNDIVANLGIPQERAFPMQTDPSSGQMVRGQDGNMMMSSEFYQAQNELTETALKNIGYKAGDMVAGIKKELIITEDLLNKPGRLAFRGGLQQDMRSYYQNGGVGPHEDTYVDYSHGARLISRYVEIDGVQMDLAKVMADENLFKLVSDDRISNAMAFYRKAGDQPQALSQDVIAKPPVADEPVSAMPTSSTTPAETSSPASVSEPTADTSPAPAPSYSSGSSAGPSAGPSTGPVAEPSYAPPAFASAEATGESDQTPAQARQPSVEAQAEQQDAVTAGTVFVLGDSLSDGYSGLLKGYKSVHVNPEGKTESKGEFTSKILQTFKDRIATQNNLEGSTLVINGGSNDLFNPDLLETTKQNLSEIYRLAKEKGMKVVGMTLPPIAYSEYSQNQWSNVRNIPKYRDLTYEQYNADLIKRWKDLNSWIKDQKTSALNEKGEHIGPDVVVELHETFEDTAQPGKLRQDVAGEGGVHLSDYKPMAEQIREGIAMANSPAEKKASEKAQPNL